MPTNFIKKYSISYILFVERKMGVSGKLNNQRPHRDTTDQAHIILRTDRQSSLGWEELGFQDPKPQFPQGPVCYWFCQVGSGLEKGLESFSVYQGLGESLGLIRPSTKTIVSYHTHTCTLMWYARMHAHTHIL